LIPGKGKTRSTVAENGEIIERLTRIEAKITVMGNAIMAFDGFMHRVMEDLDRLEEAVFEDADEPTAN
jgi:predicted nuclease with TOPRIM domain